MGDKAPTLQDSFLNACRRSRAPVTMFLVKGIKLSGIIAGFDAFSLMLRRDGQSQLVYKHGISTIAPSQPVDLKLAAPAASAKTGLQEQLLAAASGAGATVTLYLVNGVMLQGRLETYDQFAVLLTRGAQQQLVYKHAISTLTADVEVAGPDADA